MMDERAGLSDVIDPLVDRLEALEQRATTAPWRKFNPLLHPLVPMRAGGSTVIVGNSSGNLVLNARGIGTNISLIFTPKGTGTVQASAVLLIADGLVGAPGLAFSGDTDSGFFRTGSNDFSWVTGGTDRIRVNTSGEVGIAGAPISTITLEVYGTTALRSGNTFVLRNSSNNANCQLTNTGASGSATLRILAANGITMNAGLTFTNAASKIVPGATSFSHRNNADGADNVLITDAGVVTIRSTLNTVASATGAAGLNLPHGAAPTSPVDGDMWTTTSGLFVRINGTTKTVTLT